PRLLAADADGGIGPRRHPPAGALQEQAAGSAAGLVEATAWAALVDRDGQWSTGRTVSRQANVGQGSMAPVQPGGAQDPQPYRSGLGQCLARTSAVGLRLVGN